MRASAFPNSGLHVGMCVVRARVRFPSPTPPPIVTRVRVNFATRRDHVWIVWGVFRPAPPRTPDQIKTWPESCVESGRLTPHTSQAPRQSARQAEREAAPRRARRSATAAESQKTSVRDKRSSWRINRRDRTLTLVCSRSMRWRLQSPPRRGAASQNRPTSS